MIIKSKGTYDLYGSFGNNYKKVEKVIDELMSLYNYEYIRTPLFEDTNLFHRAVGETSDLVSKETYDFEDRSGRKITLRPEGTAGVVRSFIEEKMAFGMLPKKLYYLGTMYRYERPQKGRYREFTQFGIESLGSDSPLMDAEIILLAKEFIEKCGFENYIIKINSIGDKESRDNYEAALKSYLKDKVKNLCPDCHKRYEKNPLRILDCKVDASQEILKNVPKLSDYLNETSKSHFKKVLELLDQNLINYQIDDNLVRGLDYYDHTVFEIQALVDNKFLALGGGGRYNHLVESLGGPNIPAVGFASGIERLIMLLEAEVLKSLDAFIMAVSESERDFAFKLAKLLREYKFKVDIDFQNKSLKAQFKLADNNKAKYLIILNDEDLKNDEIVIKNNKTKEEEKIYVEYLINYLEDKLNLEDYEYEENI